MYYIDTAAYYSKPHAFATNVSFMRISIRYKVVRVCDVWNSTLYPDGDTNCFGIMCMNLMQLRSMVDFVFLLSLLHPQFASFCPSHSHWCFEWVLSVPATRCVFVVAIKKYNNSPRMFAGFGVGLSLRKAEMNGHFAIRERCNFGALAHGGCHSSCQFSLPKIHLHPYFKPRLQLESILTREYVRPVSGVHFDQSTVLQSTFGAKRAVQTLLIVYCMKMSWNKASHFTFDASNRMLQCTWMRTKNPPYTATM